MLADSGNSGPVTHNAGRVDAVNDHNTDKDSQDQCQTCDKCSSDQFQLLGFLLFLLLPLSQDLGFLLLADLLFAGCAHVNHFLSFVSFCTRYAKTHVL